MSVIYYKFKAAKDTDYKVFTFDGPSAAVFDVKKEIIRAERLGKGYDFDLALYNAQADDEYREDAHMIPRNTSVIWRRLPAARPGKGTAYRYVQGAAPEARGMVTSSMLKAGQVQTQPAAGGRHMVLNARQQQQQQHRHAPQQPTITPAGVNSSNLPQTTRPNASQDPSATKDGPESAATDDDSEEARIAAMFQQETDHWGAVQETMAEQQYIPYMNRGGAGGAQRGRGGHFAGGPNRASGAPNGSTTGGSGNNGEYTHPQKVPPPNYVCYRCGQKGHFINQCPTNGDRDYDHHPRIKRTTGIPKSFLKVIDAPESAVKSGTGGLMVTPTGEIVVAQADSSAWNQHMARAATASSGDVSDWYDSVPVPDYLQCPLSKDLMREASISTCCGASFCDECIRNHLMDHNFTCPNCNQPVPQGLDGLVPNTEVRQWIDHYVRQYATSSRQNQDAPPPLASQAPVETV
ncbi:DWNN domain-containing protein [Gongronella butleri]|nr:DWNN domain-containing protein [Gongronella butleri]